MWAILLKGGIIMAPLTLLSVLGVAVFIEKLINLRASKVLQQEVIGCIESLRTPTDVPMAMKICERHNSPIANIIHAGLEEAEHQSTLLEIRTAMEDTGRREVKRLERYLVVLETVAAASPLLGLLGTVFGMIKVFSVISIAGVGQTGRLAGGIAEALITTAFGLSIGIPALVAYNFFDSRVENYVIKIEANVHALLKQISTMRKQKPAKVREISDAP
jgi:biopolymer transport protein ExbB